MSGKSPDRVTTTLTFRDAPTSHLLLKAYIIAHTHTHLLTHDVCSHRWHKTVHRTCSDHRAMTKFMASVVVRCGNVVAYVDDITALQHVMHTISPPRGDGEASLATLATASERILEVASRRWLATRSLCVTSRTSSSATMWTGACC